MKEANKPLELPGGYEFYFLPEADEDVVRGVCKSRGLRLKKIKEFSDGLRLVVCRKVEADEWNGGSDELSGPPKHLG